jgi:hypothetical protein
MILHVRSSIRSPQRSQMCTHSRAAGRVTVGRSLVGLVMAPACRGHTTEVNVLTAAAPRPYTLGMDEQWSDPEFLRAVFSETEIVRKPLTGIISGYHVLPYILVAPEHDQPARAVEVRGRIKVSPRLVLTAGSDGPTYGELFGERELMDHRLVARVFSFRYASKVVLESEDLAIRRHEHDPARHLERVLDELSRREVIDTGVIVSPDARFYPVSLDRFIREILDQEFRE